MKFTPNSKIRGILFVKPLSETSFPRFSGRGEQLQIRVLGTFYIGQILEFCNTYYRTIFVVQNELKTSSVWMFAL